MLGSETASLPWAIQVWLGMQELLEFCVPLLDHQPVSVVNGLFHAVQNVHIPALFMRSPALDPEVSIFPDACLEWIKIQHHVKPLEITGECVGLEHELPS
jgi:hypothetical protein